MAQTRIGGTSRAPDGARGVRWSNMGLVESIVYVVDDDLSTREAISSLLRSEGLVVETFASARDFRAHDLRGRACCLVLDVQLPDASGFEVQSDLTSRRVHLPIIFLTGHGTIPMTVRAIKGGAVEFLTKPFTSDELVKSVRAALRRDEETREERDALLALRACYDLLTAREKEVGTLIIAGRMNKQVAAELGISEITVKVHRRRLLEKLGIRTVADLVRIGEQLGLSRDPTTGRYTKV